MNFSEQLDKFIERGAEEYATKWCGVNSKEQGASGIFLRNACVKDHKQGASSLKPIVLKLMAEMKKIASPVYDPKVHGSKTYVAEKALAEIEKMIDVKTTREEKENLGVDLPDGEND